MASSPLKVNPALMKASDARGELPQRHPRNKKSTREKIDKLVADGAKNYPAYLKLIYTGDSELSSEDEFCADHKAKLNVRRGQVPKAHHQESDFVANAPAVFSPESTKLLDPGCEKIPTPVDHSCPLKEDLESIPDDHACEGATSHELNDMKPMKQSGEQEEVRRTTEEEKELEELRLELIQVQEDIATLKAVLGTKMKVAADLKRKLGITPMAELKQSIQHIKESGTYQKTNAAFRSFGAFASRKMGTFRNSSMFKSVEEKVGGAYGTVKTTMSSSRSENNVAEMTMHATDPIDDETRVEEAYNAVSNPYAGKNALVIGEVLHNHWLVEGCNFRYVNTVNNGYHSDINTLGHAIQSLLLGLQIDAKRSHDIKLVNRLVTLVVRMLGCRPVKAKRVFGGF